MKDDHANFRSRWTNRCREIIVSYALVLQRTILIHSLLGIRAIPSEGQNTTVGNINSAILRYDSALPVEPTSRPTQNPIILDQSDLHVRLSLRFD